MGVPADQVGGLARAAFLSTQTNPRTVKAADYETMLRAVW